MITSTVFFKLAARVWKDQEPEEDDDNEVDDVKEEDQGSLRFWDKLKGRG